MEIAVQRKKIVTQVDSMLFKPVLNLAKNERRQIQSAIEDALRWRLEAKKGAKIEVESM